MAFKMRAAPFKNVEELKEVVGQLEGAVKAHGKQAKTIQKHVNMMEGSPAKKKNPTSSFDGYTKIASSKSSNVIAAKKSAATRKNPKSDYKFTQDKEGVTHLYQKTGSPVKLKDACYRKAKAKYDVFPSAYASGYIAKCRKRGGKIK